MAITEKQVQHFWSNLGKPFKTLWTSLVQKKIVYSLTKLPYPLQSCIFSSRFVTPIFLVWKLSSRNRVTVQFGQSSAPDHFYEVIADTHDSVVSIIVQLPKFCNLFLRSVIHHVKCSKTSWNIHWHVSTCIKHHKTRCW